MVNWVWKIFKNEKSTFGPEQFAQVLFLQQMDQWLWTISDPSFRHSGGLIYTVYIIFIQCFPSILHGTEVVQMMHTNSHQLWQKSNHFVNALMAYKHVFTWLHNIDTAQTTYVGLSLSLIGK